MSVGAGVKNGVKQEQPNHSRTQSRARLKHARGGWASEPKPRTQPVRGASSTWAIRSGRLGPHRADLRDRARCLGLTDLGCRRSARRVEHIGPNGLTRRRIGAKDDGEHAHAQRTRLRCWSIRASQPRRRRSDDHDPLVARSKIHVGNGARATIDVAPPVDGHWRPDQRHWTTGRHRVYQ